jgi:hypothetical protein
MLRLYTRATLSSTWHFDTSHLTVGRCLRRVHGAGARAHIAGHACMSQQRQTIALHTHTNTQREYRATTRTLTAVLGGAGSTSRSRAYALRAISTLLSRASSRASSSASSSCSLSCSSAVASGQRASASSARRSSSARCTRTRDQQRIIHTTYKVRPRVVTPVGACRQHARQRAALPRRYVA